MAYGPSYTNRDSTRTAPSSSPAADHWGMREWPAPSGFVLAASRDALRRHRPDYAVTGRHLGVRRSPALTAPVGEGLAGSRHGCQPARAAHPECHAERGHVGPESKHPLSSPERRRDREGALASGDSSTRRSPRGSLLARNDSLMRSAGSGPRSLFRVPCSGFRGAAGPFRARTRTRTRTRAGGGPATSRQRQATGRAGVERLATSNG